MPEMKFDLQKIIEDVERLGFEEAWKNYSLRIPESSCAFSLPNEKGREHKVFKVINALRSAFIELGFEEVMNPLFIPEQDVYMQYGPEAPVILDRVYYLAGLPRPDIGLEKETVEKIEREIGRIDITKLREVLRKYREREIEADELIEVLKKELSLKEAGVLRLLEIFREFFNLTPEPLPITLRSHMTGAWFKTIADMLEHREPPLYLFSIDWVFRREQREDKAHLRYYHSASVVVVHEDLSVEDAQKLTLNILSKIQEKLGVSFANPRIVKKSDTARYYAFDKEWEVYVTFRGEEYEIGTFGFYNPISLAKYKIPFPVYNFGMGVERIVQVISGIEDIRNVLFPHRICDMSDAEIAKKVRAIKSPKTEWGRKLVKKLCEIAEKMKDKKGVFKELVYSDERIKIYFAEPDEGKNFLGPAALNKIYVFEGNIISTQENFEKGIYLGSYLELIFQRIIGEIEEGKEGHFKVRWVEGPSDVNLFIPEKVVKWMNENGKKIEIKGPVFIDVIVEKQKT